MTDGTLTGRCFCGAVRVTLPADSVGVIACHCTDCRQMHGTYNAMIGAPRDAVCIEGAEAVEWFASSEKARRGFCRVCGSRLFKDNLGSERLMVSAGIIDGPTGKRIIRNLFEGSKGDWYPLPETA